VYTLTRVIFPVKVLLRLAGASEIQTGLLLGGAMREWDMVVGDLVPEVDLFLLQHQRGGNRVHRCVTPTLVEETAILV
jgi:hypothetical protein